MTRWFLFASALASLCLPTAAAEATARDASVRNLQASLDVALKAIVAKDKLIASLITEISALKVVDHSTAATVGALKSDSKAAGAALDARVKATKATLVAPSPQHDADVTRAEARISANGAVAAGGDTPRSTAKNSTVQSSASSIHPSETIEAACREPEQQEQYDDGQQHDAAVSPLLLASAFAVALLALILRSAARVRRLWDAHDVTVLKSDNMRHNVASGKKDVMLRLLVALLPVIGLMVLKPIISAQTHDAAQDAAVWAALVCAAFGLVGCAVAATAGGDTLSTANGASTSRSSCAEIKCIQTEAATSSGDMYPNIAPARQCFDKVLQELRAHTLSGFEGTSESTVEERANTLDQSVEERAGRNSPFPYSDMRAKHRQAGQLLREDKDETQARRRKCKARPGHVSRPEGRREKRKRNRFCRWGRTNDYLKKSGGKCIDSAKKRPPRHVRRVPSGNIRPLLVRRALRCALAMCCITFVHSQGCSLSFTGSEPAFLATAGSAPFTSEDGMFIDLGAGINEIGICNADAFSTATSTSVLGSIGCAVTKKNFPMCGININEKKSTLAGNKTNFVTSGLGSDRGAVIFSYDCAMTRGFMWFSVFPVLNFFTCFLTACMETSKKGYDSAAWHSHPEVSTTVISRDIFAMMDKEELKVGCKATLCHSPSFFLLRHLMRAVVAVVAALFVGIQHRAQLWFFLHLILYAISAQLWMLSWLFLHSVCHAIEIISSSVCRSIDNQQVLAAAAAAKPVVRSARLEAANSVGAALPRCRVIPHWRHCELAVLAVLAHATAVAGSGQVALTRAQMASKAVSTGVPSFEAVSSVPARDSGGADRRLADASADIDNAVDGAIITLSAGNYTWSNEKTITKTITIQGAGQDSTILDRKTGGRFFTVNSGGHVTVKHLTLTGGYTVGAACWGDVSRACAIVFPFALLSVSLLRDD